MTLPLGPVSVTKWEGLSRAPAQLDLAKSFMLSPHSIQLDDERPNDFFRGQESGPKPSLSFGQAVLMLKDIN